MIDPSTQHEVPTGTDAPERAWHNRLSDSIRDVLTFANLADANTWADEPLNAEFAVSGRIAWITAENALYVLADGAWVGLNAVESATVPSTAANLQALAFTVERTGWMVTAAVSIQPGTAASGTVVGTVPSRFVPRSNRWIPLVPNSTIAANAFLQVTSGTGAATLYFYNATSATTYLRGTGAWAAAAA